MFRRISEFNANRVDPDQTSRSAASDLGLHCLSMFHLWDARLKCVNTKPFGITVEDYAKFSQLFQSYPESP